MSDPFLLLAAAATLLSFWLLIAWARGRFSASISSDGIKVALCTTLIFFLFFATPARAPEPETVIFIADFVAFYAAGQLLRDNPEGLYDQESQGEYERQAVGLDQVSGVLLPFPYPPPVAVPFAGLAFFSYTTAYQLFLVANLIGLILLVTGLLGKLTLGKRDVPVFLLFCLLLQPLHFCLIKGQLSIWTTLAFSCYLLSVRRGSQAMAGVWVGLLTLKPSLALLPVLFLAFNRYWRGLLAAALFTLSLWGLSALWIGTDGVRGFVALAGEISRGQHPAMAVESMWNLRALDYWVGAGGLLWLPLSALIVFCLGMSLWRAPTNPLNLVAVCLATLLVAPHLFIHDLLLVVPALAIYLEGSPTRGKRRLAYLYWGLGSIPWIVPTLRITASVQPAIVAVVLAVLFARVIHKTRREQ